MKIRILLGLFFSASAVIGADAPQTLTTLRTGKVIRVGARLERINPANPSLPQATASHEAEPINATAMRQYQQRWESHARNPQLSPALYPSRIERAFGIPE